jgi:hypothetical protein
MTQKKRTPYKSQDPRFQAVVAAFLPWARRVGEALGAEVSVQSADNGRVIMTGPPALSPLLRQEQDWLFFRTALEQTAAAADCVVGVGDTAIVAWWRADLAPKSKTPTPSGLQQPARAIDRRDEEEAEPDLFSVMKKGGGSTREGQ